MRLVSSIMIIIITALHLAPCQDVLVSKTDNIHITVQNGLGEHNENSRDDCSPFCSCACCAIPSVTQAKLTVTVHVSRYNTRYLSHSSGNHIDVSLPIWQPPKRTC